MSATKVKNNLHGPHTAGIFADLSVDGPEIGTLVAIVDRAKNLPNRKTIGKQDPYCAMRLGKEAKKTATDIRGGQTPRWDQELRFTVHDGPDYYQLKISIFTDDKRTDLVGEAWVDLKSIIVPGGGQGDIWQTLSCRGKYAGEIRVEITYYDTRPKPEKPVAKPRPQPAATDRESGPVKQRTAPMGRRPLPSDPITGEAPVAPQAPAPAPVPAPAPAPAKPSPAQDQYQTPPRAHAKHASHSGYVPNHSPLQSLEYQTPPPASRHQQPDPYSPSPHAQHQAPVRTELPRQSHRPVDPYETPQRHYDDREYSPRGPVQPYQQPEPRGQSLPEHYDHLPDSRQLPPVEDDRPPPPPAHRTAYGGGGALEVSHRSSFDGSSQKPLPPPMSMRHDVLKNEAHRHSMSAYPPTRPAFRPYDSASSAPIPVSHQDVPSSYEPPQPRHHSYEPGYDPHPRSMQATVEDVPDSLTGPYGQVYRHSGSRNPPTEDMGYDHAPSPAPLNLSRSPGASPLHHNSSHGEVAEGYHDQGYQRQVSPAASREFSTSPGRGHHDQPAADRGMYQRYGSEYEERMQRPVSHGMPELPASLVPGVDPSLALELSDRIRDERRHERRYTTQNIGTPPRGRHTSEPPPAYGPNEGGSSYGYAPSPQQPYERRSGTDVSYSGGPEQRRIQSHSTSPAPQDNPQHTIKRKSVSPAPPPAENRRASGVPFGPDSFDAFNTNIVTTRDDRALADVDAKIVTYDGREVDPSDHLPVESWAPEPEAKLPKQPSPEPRARPSPSGAQPMPPSGRRQLRVAARPQPPPGAPHTSYGPQEPHTPPAPSSAGRNRLHKKTRSSAGPSLGGAGSRPLAPISSENYQERQIAYTPTRGGPQRSPNHHDYPNENHAPQYGSGPPIPAKVPYGGAMMSGANPAAGDDALMQEMQRIDIGAGRSRRRQGY